MSAAQVSLLAESLAGVSWSTPRIDIEQSSQDQRSRLCMHSWGCEANDLIFRAPGCPRRRCICCDGTTRSDLRHQPEHTILVSLNSGVQLSEGHLSPVGNASRPPCVPEGAASMYRQRMTYQRPSV